MEYFRFEHCDNGMELLARASTEGNVKAGYLCAHLLKFDHEEEGEVQRGVQMMEVIRISGQLESCIKFLRDISKDIMVLLLEMLASERRFHEEQKEKERSQDDHRERTVSVEYECPLNLLPRDIWVRIATKVVSYSIKDRFNMQATCKVFLGAARSDAVYKEASMLELPIASFLYYYGRPEHSFIECCTEAENPAALLWVGMTEFVWLSHCVGGMDTLTMAATRGDLEACYMCAMLLLSYDNEHEEHLQKGLEFLEIVSARKVFAGPWVEVKPLDPGLPEVCLPPITAPEAPWVMWKICPTSRVCSAWPITRFGCFVTSAKPLQMTGSSKTNRKEGNVLVEHECPLNLLPRDIWVRIATKVVSNSIHDLFNMQASCKIFLDAASFEAVYQHATMRVIPLVSFLFYPDRPERRFLDRCIEAENVDAILRQGLTEYF
ncbi:hypothetical protein Ahy_B03g066621 isoform A [Arachis hypogaea]|uniref:At2g35280-like TPR domain-containing protein n=1 Tax=Arachis hypogaea TaxID=3818 RepID=A0A445A4E4_ARAHY|nr:hypothetical protein Ahy_B03g066621 isoform A [Arachis hypogaea]